MRVASLAFFRPEAAAKHRANTERIEIIRRNDSTRSTLRAMADAERRARDSIDSERLDESCVSWEIQHSGVGELLHAAKFAKGGITRLFRRHAGGDVALG